MIIYENLFFIAIFIFYFLSQNAIRNFFFLMIHDTISKNKVNHCDLFSKICIRIFFFYASIQKYDRKISLPFFPKK